ncbi:MAG TPA: dihydrolipoamide acetyltransferase family protein [Streptosporangiaceae bacterium]|nr:dihydrolipoamide acetyltransferase family protein [Streptosporangiaceae bacterium]
MTELKQFRLPDVGEGLTEADIVAWRVKPGDKVSVNQVIVDIETAKAVVELPCPFDGVVTELLAGEGQTVDVGTPIITVDTAPGGEGAPQSPQGPGETRKAAGAPAARGAGDKQEAEREGGPAPAPEEERQSVLVGYGVRPGATTRRKRKPGYVPAPAGAGTAGAPPAPAAAAPAAAPVRPAPAPPLAKPPVRKLARDLGVDLAGLSGTGPQGSITREDVQRAAERPATARSAGTFQAPAGGPAAGAGSLNGTAGLREERIPVRGVRKHTAAAMTSSAFSAPHVTEFLQVDMTGTMSALQRVRELPEFSGLRVSPLLFVARALLIAVARHPMINSSWDEDAREIVVRRYVNLGIAAATERGLLVPNIKDAHALTLPQLARALADLAAAARDGRSSPADLTGGTITITNVGVFGVDAGTPILTPGEAAILAFGQIREAPWVHEGQLAVRKVTTLSLSFDHRIVDGDLGSAVLRDIGAMLEDPVRMIAWG